MSHTHSDFAKRPIDGTGAMMDKRVLSRKKQVFEVFKGDNRGKDVTVTTPQFGSIHGVAIQTSDQLNLRFLIGKFPANIF